VELKSIPSRRLRPDLPVAKRRAEAVQHLAQRRVGRERGRRIAPVQATPPLSAPVAAAGAFVGPSDPPAEGPAASAPTPRR